MVLSRPFPINTNLLTLSSSTGQTLGVSTTSYNSRTDCAKTLQGPPVSNKALNRIIQISLLTPDFNSTFLSHNKPCSHVSRREVLMGDWVVVKEAVVTNCGV